MRTLAAAAALFCCGGAFAQYHGSIQPYVTGGFGSVVFPAGTAATNPGLTRITPNVVYPGGGGPHLVVPNPNPGAQSTYRGYNATRGGYPYAYPVYVGSYGSVYDASAVPQQGQQQAAPNITIVMPPSQPAQIVTLDSPARPQMQVYQPEPQTSANQQQDEPSSDNPHYLLAFKDHTIYSAIAYWVDGDTLHYFTAGNNHNQVSLSLVDRDLTERLNKDAGVQVKLPAK